MTKMHTRNIPWYERYLPSTLQVPPEFAGHDALSEVLPDLRQQFESYWQSQTDRVEHDDDAMHQTREEAFAAEVSFFCRVSDTIQATYAEQGGPVMALFDVDETIGRVAESGRRRAGVPAGLIEPGFSPADSPQELLRRHYLKDSFDRLQLRPALGPVVNYLKDHYGRSIELGILSTKNQEGLDKHLLPRLQQLCPGAFRPELVMSSRDGAAERLVPEVTKGWGKRGMLTLSAAFESIIPGSPSDRELVPARVADLGAYGGGEVDTTYDTKLLMMSRLLQDRRAAATARLRHGAPANEQDYHAWHTQADPNPTIVLFDDMRQDAVRPDNPSLQWVNVPRYRLPDSLF